MSVKEMEWYRLLPNELYGNAYRSLNDELAWCREQALHVIEILVSKGYVVTKVDVWIPTEPGPTIPTPFVYDWSLKGRHRKDTLPESAKEFVRKFDWDLHDENNVGIDPVFNIWAAPYSS
jgi:hypothetical protein